MSVRTSAGLTGETGGGADLDAADQCGVSVSGVGEGSLVLCELVHQQVGEGQVSVESGERGAAARHRVLGRSRTSLSGLPGRHPGALV
jgi:hypothetical protein